MRKLLAPNPANGERRHRYPDPIEIDFDGEYVAEVQRRWRETKLKSAFDGRHPLRDVIKIEDERSCAVLTPTFDLQTVDVIVVPRHFLKVGFRPRERRIHIFLSNGFWLSAT